MSRADCRECDGDGGCCACGGTGLGDYALDADDECPDCNGGGLCSWCDGRGYLDVPDDAGAALERLAVAARSLTSDPNGPARREIDRDEAIVRAALDDRAAAWRIADAASEAASDARRLAGFPMGGTEA